MVGCKFSLTCLILIFCVINVRSETTGINQCGIKIPCDDSQCIDRTGWCDFATDCTDESDEKHCQKRSYFPWPSTPDNKCDAERHFTCENRMCIPKVLTCDGHDDCEDNSDEENCDSSETDETVGPDSLNSSSTESTRSLPTDVPPHPSSTGFLHNIRPVESTVDYYGHRLTEGENIQRHYSNSPTATASAYPTIYPPDPTPNSRIPPASGWNRNERSFGNVGRQGSPGYFIRGAPTNNSPNSPSEEPCDKTTARPDDDSTSHYRAPWSSFTFGSNQNDIKNWYEYYAKRTQEWFLAQRDYKLIWGENMPRTLVALSLSSDPTNNLAADDILQRQLRIDLGVNLIKWREGKLSFSTSRLALYINAFIATCQNPRSIFERDLVEMLYEEVQKERETRTDASPFPYLTLCIADRPLTTDDRRFLLDIARRDVTDEISKDKFILATSALACLKKVHPHDRELEQSVDEAFQKLQQQQLSDGSFGSVYSTALAAQALIAIDSRSWQPQTTLNYLSSKQRDDGSFGDFLATYYALPALNGKSLLHLRNIQCTTNTNTTSPTDPCKSRNCHHLCRNNTKTGAAECYCYHGYELDPNDNRTCNKIPPPSTNKTVKYRLENEKQRRTIATLDLVVPAKDNFFEIMEKAQAQNKLFQFLYVEHDNKIDVYQISEIPNDPEFGLFWILYEVDRRNGDKRRYTQDIRNLIPEDSAELLFSYKYFQQGDQ